MLCQIQVRFWHQIIAGLIQIPLPVISQGSKYEVWHGRRLLAALDSRGPGPGRSVFGRLCVGSSHTSSSAFAPLSLVPFLPIGALVFPKIKALNSIKCHWTVPVCPQSPQGSAGDPGVAQTWPRAHSRSGPGAATVNSEHCPHTVHCSWNRAPFITAHFC